MEWARNLAGLALRQELKDVKTKAGKPAKRKHYTPVLDEDGNPVLELTCPHPMVQSCQRYLVLKTRKLRIDHLPTYSKYKPVTEYRDEQLKEPKPEVSHTDIQKACPPNLIHASDACQLAFTVDGYAGNFTDPGRLRVHGNG